MKIYISLPISGKDIEEVKQLSEIAKNEIIEKGHTPVSPLDVSPNTELSYAQHMGNDIAALLECDAIVFLGDWHLSKGCRLEMNAAVIYDKKIFSNLDSVL